MFPLHRLFDARMCGALTIGTGLNTKVFADGILAAVEGDVNTHMNLGQLQALASKVFIQGKPAIPAIMSMGLPDIMGIIPHVKGFPIPVDGSKKVFINALGMASGGAGFGMLQPIFGGLGGIIGYKDLINGEMLQMGQQVVGQIMNFTQVGGGQAVVQVANLQAQNIPTNATFTGQQSGNTISLSRWYDSRTYANT